MLKFDPIQAVLFDLDGTLLDTAADLTQATNHVLIHHRRPTKSINFVRPLIGGGTREIITKTFNIDQHDKNYTKIRHQLLDAYQQLYTNKTLLFEGMEHVLALLSAKKIPWGIITNKPYWLALPIINHFKSQLPQHCLLGRESLPVAKPNPLPLIYASQQLQVAQQHCVYVGDAKTDIIAANLAKMHSVAAAYGYIPAHENPQEWNADVIIHQPIELYNWLKPRLKES